MRRLSQERGDPKQDVYGINRNKIKKTTSLLHFAVFLFLLNSSNIQDVVTPAKMQENNFACTLFALHPTCLP